MFRSVLSFHSQPTGCVFRAPWVMLQHFTEPDYLDTLTKTQDLCICLVLLYMFESLFLQMVTLRRRVWWLNGFLSQIKKHKGSFGSFHFSHLALGATFHFCYDLLIRVYSESQHALAFLLDWAEICPGHPISTADDSQVSYQRSMPEPKPIIVRFHHFVTTKCWFCIIVNSVILLHLEYISTAC